MEGLGATDSVTSWQGRTARDSHPADQRNFNAYMCFGTITLLDDPLKLILPLAVIAEALYGGSSSDA